MKTFNTARTIARNAVFANARLNGRGEEINAADKAIGVRMMSNLLWDVLAQDGGFLGLSDSAFDAFCARNHQYVDLDLARAAMWARTIRWPDDGEQQQKEAA